MPKKKEEILTVSESGHDAASCGDSCGNSSSFSIWMAMLVVVIAQVVATAVITDVNVKRTVDKTIEGMKEMEYKKVGGKETYDLVNRAQQLQLQEQIDQIRAFVESKGGVAGDGGTAAPAEAKVLSPEEVQAIGTTAYYDGAEGAKIAAVEYTDPECPFCIRQAKDGALSQLLEKYAGNIKVSHKPLRAVPHPGAEAKSVALLCVGKIAGAKAYNAMYQGMMDRSTMEKVMPVDDILGLVKELKVDEKAFAACADAKETVPEYDANTAEGNKYGVKGTPGTIIFNVETGKYKTIEGAYPFSAFEAAVEAVK